MPWSANAVRASLQRNSSRGVRGIGCCASCRCNGLGDCSYNDATGDYDLCTDSSTDSGVSNLPLMQGVYASPTLVQNTPIYPISSAATSGSATTTTQVAAILNSAANAVRVASGQPTYNAAGQLINPSTGLPVSTGIAGSAGLMMLAGVGLLLVVMAGKK